MISVMTELPFLKNIPPRAGRSAKAKGAECHAEVDDSWFSSPIALGFGSSRSSVEDLKFLRASLSEKSLNPELLRRTPAGEGASVALRLTPGVGGSMVEKRFGGGLCRNCELSSPVRTLRIGVPAGLAGVGEVGVSPMPMMMRFSAFLGKLARAPRK
jgi:hypothetical protein